MAQWVIRREVRWLGCALAFGAAWAAHGAAEAQTKVCVEVEVRSWNDEGAPVQPVHEQGAPSTTPEASSTEHEAAAAPTEAQSEARAPTDPAQEATADAAAASGDAGETPEAPVTDDSEFSESEPFTSHDGFGVRPRQIFRRVTAQPATPPPPTTRRQSLEPSAYLRRLLEYQVTHTDGYEAEQEGCAEHLRVQLYPLEVGYTVFARYSGTSREEKVDDAAMDEFRALAQRLASALLGDEPIESTLTRRTVLRSDSEGDLRRIHGDRQFLFGLGTFLLAGNLPTAPNATLPAQEKLRLVAPLSATMGARRAFRAWALDAYGNAIIGTSRKALSRAAGGGHADYVFGLGLTLHFLRYLHPDAVNSLYGGGGASFQLHAWRTLPADSRGNGDNVYGGGMNVDLVLGYEVMRASSLHFFVEAQAVLPTYQFDGENYNGRVRSYIPGALVQIGILR